MWISTLVFFLFSGHVYSQDINKPQADTFLDSLAHKLKLEKWEKDEAPCLESALNVLENVKNHTLWATWMWNANSLPTGNLYGSARQYASYDQCLKPPWLHTHPQLKTKYCFTDFLLSDESDSKKVAEYNPFGPTLTYINSPSISGASVNHIMWAVCIPASCSSSAVSKLSRVVYEAATFSTIASDVTVKHCQEAGASPPFSAGFYIFIVLVLLLVATAVASTYYRKHVPAEDQSSNYLIKIITTSFCMAKNREALVKDNKDEIRVMNGIRFLSAVCIVILHVVFYMTLSGISNSRDVDMYMEGIGGLFFHYDLIVDTFFAISGLLHMKGLLSRRQNLFGVLWKRYIRLIGPFALIVFYIISVSEHFSSGPGWFGWEETSICENYWLQNLFMINSDMGQICHAVSWYVCCDYQLAILATVLFFLYKMNKIFGYTVYVAVAILSMVIPGVLTYLLQMPAMPYMEYGKYILRFREIWQFNHIYIAFYGRGGPYVVGIAMGYIMGIYKPADYRKSVTKTWSIITMVVSLSGLAVMMALGYIIINFIPLEPGVVAGTSRIIWAAAICGVIGMCEYGTVPVIPSILGWSVFTPLSRLSYGIYMIHPLIVQRHKLSQRSAHLFDIYCILVDSAGVLAISIGLSYAMWLFVEAPLININNYIFFNRSKRTESDKRSGENGVQHQNGVANTNVLSPGIQQNKGRGENEMQHQDGIAKTKALLNDIQPERGHGENGIHHHNGDAKTDIS